MHAAIAKDRLSSLTRTGDASLAYTRTENNDRSEGERILNEQDCFSNLFDVLAVCDVHEDELLEIVNFLHFLIIKVA